MRHLKIIIFIILLIVFIKIYIFSFDKFIVNDKKWLNYRLGDIVKGFFFNQNGKKYLNLIEKKLPNSIGGKYIKLTKNLYKEKDKINNLEILTQIIKENSKNIDTPNLNDIVFHIRLGDIIKDFKNNEVIIKKKNWGINLNQIEDILKSLKNKNQKIILIYGSHKNNINLKSNNMFLSNIKKKINVYGFEYEEKNTNNPDRDFIYMCNSKNFIKSGGGFSRLISHIVKKKGGKIINEDMYT